MKMAATEFGIHPPRSLVGSQLVAGPPNEEDRQAGPGEWPGPALVKIGNVCQDLIRSLFGVWQVLQSQFLDVFNQTLSI